MTRSLKGVSFLAPRVSLSKGRCTEGSVVLGSKGVFVKGKMYYMLLDYDIELKSTEENSSKEMTCELSGGNTIRCQISAIFLKGVRCFSMLSVQAALQGNHLEGAVMLLLHDFQFCFLEKEGVVRLGKTQTWVPQKQNL